MAIKIGHASIDENGKISGGTAGDQTQKEVCTRTWYSKPWGFVLRCKDSNKAEKMAIACEQGCANNKIGYDQTQRNTLYTQAKNVNYDLSKIITACECDCSSFMVVCALAAGIKITYGTNAPTTSTMKTVFSTTGEFDILTDTKYLSSDSYLKRGDILVKAGSHTAMVLENGININTSTNNNIISPTSTSSCIDVSLYQGNIDWKKVKQSGVDYAILRGVIKNGTLDSTFEKNYFTAIQNGVKILGVYQFSYALNENTAKNDAINMVNKLNGKKIDIWLDLEWSTQRNLGNYKVTSIAKTYVNTCKELGYTCHIYSNLDWYKNVYNSTELKNMGCKFWIARYPSQDHGTIKESLKPNVGEYIWQYSSKGSVDGISGDVDMNIVYGKIDSVTTPPPLNITNETSVGTLGKINTKSGNLNIRSTPSSTSTKVGSYKKGELVYLISKTSTNWYKTDKGYISGEYVTTAKGKVVNCTKLNMRSTPNVEINNVVCILLVNDTMEIIGRVANGWYQVKTKDNLVGYVSNKYIAIT